MLKSVLKFKFLKLSRMSRACTTNGGKREMHLGVWWECQKERDHYEVLDVDGSIILK
jgi:hypothetical protein